jgi:hypothetical protein
MDFSKYRPRVIPDRADEIGVGIWRWYNDGSVVVVPTFYSDPTKANEQWLADQREGSTIDGFEREVLINFEAWTGKRVFPEYNDAMHLSKKPLPHDPNLPIMIGVDIPGPAAAVWVQLYPLMAARNQLIGYRLNVLAEILMESGVQDFGHAILATNATRFPKCQRFVYYADPAAFDSVDHDKHTAADILRLFCGIHMNRGPINLIERLEPLRRWLSRSIPVNREGEPNGALLVDPSCKLVLDAFRGGYYYKQMTTTARYREVPEKQCESSHIMDALAYPVSKTAPQVDTKPIPYKPLKWNPDNVLGALT